MSTIPFTPLGAIFDVDDTLLNNYPDTLELGLHEQARLMAIHEVGKQSGIEELINTTVQQNKTVIRRAKEHSVEGGIWQLFYELGLVTTPIIDHSNELLRLIAKRKHEQYEPILASYGMPLPGAVNFVKALSLITDGRIAIASGAQKHNVLTFLETSGLAEVFPSSQIICRQDFARAKPDPESFLTAFNTLGLSINQLGQVVAFEDDPKGVESAKRAGLYVCAITSRYTADELKNAAYPPDLVRGSYVEFARDFGVKL